MTDTLQMYGRYVAVSLRSQMQYRTSFWLMTAGMFLGTAAEFAGIVFLFQRFGSLRGWTLPEVALMYGLVNVAYAITECAARGFDTFAALVKAGDFDRLLLRPRGTILQVAGRDFQLMRIGRLAQGAVAMAWALAELHTGWASLRLLLLAAAIAGGACMFSGLYILQATMSFWTVEGLEIMNALTYGGTETAQYPLTIYRPWFRRFFTFVVPLACVNYLPVEALLGRRDTFGAPPIIEYAAPVAGLAFLLICAQVWKLGVRHYRSTGS